MLSKTAKWYDLLCSFKDYEQETNTIVKLLQTKHPKAKTILDVACGDTAEHGRYWKQDYEVNGLDINEGFLAFARKKNPKDIYFCGNMAEFDLSKKYDVMLCLFSSIGYFKTIDNVML